MIDDLYRTIRAAAGDALVIGCNTVSHLSAGVFEICRIGDDTSGTEWARTRKMGVNTLAFRGVQHGAFYVADADCVGVTNAVPWSLNRQWLDLLARSGTMLFVSLAPDALGDSRASRSASGARARGATAAARRAARLAADGVAEPLALDGTRGDVRLDGCPGESPVAHRGSVMTLNRREFIVATGAFVGASVVASAFDQDRQPSLSAAEADALFDRSVVIDALSADEEWQDPEPIFAAYKTAGVAAIHTSLANRDLAVAKRDLTTWQARFDRFPDRLMKITRAADFAAARKTGRVGVLLGFQNATIVESDVRNLDVLHAAGTRCIQLTYNSRNLLGDGCTERTNAGLSDFGVAVVARMNELGIVVDLSHCGEATSRDGIEVSKRPPAFTHTMCKTIYDHVRAKSDALLKAMSDKGGVTGIATLGYFIGPTPDTVARRLSPSRRSRRERRRHRSRRTRVRLLDSRHRGHPHARKLVRPAADQLQARVPRPLAAVDQRAGSAGAIPQHRARPGPARLS